MYNDAHGWVLAVRCKACFSSFKVRAWLTVPRPPRSPTPVQVKAKKKRWPKTDQVNALTAGVPGEA